MKVVYGELETKSKFWGKSVEVFLYGCEVLRTKPWGDEFRWSRATICVSDVILGNYWIQVYGKVKVMNAKTGEYAMLNFKPCRGRKQDRGLCDAVVYDAKGQEVWKIDGSVHESLTVQLTPRAAAARKLHSAPPPEVIWTKEPYPEDAAMQYWFTRFAIGLNDPADPIMAHVPPTDTRFRQDQRALELGEFNRSTTEKLRLEEKQRQVRRERAARGIKYEPLWFKQVDPNSLAHLPHEKGMAWQFNPDYWRRAEQRDWSVCPDLYSVDGVPVPPTNVE
ncbi:Oxysterol-binding protein [Dunaliella salina]|uniref:Oxysterol-binding protein n=1 Tax=Dunaliella salina TaxID=3046 RepID=A0ABQ7H1D9_DUNSA|nr:Oxysterol-binding protein [Dunaliella salina]|eukprot:KAF5840679.1 Oxysterol-binding protein [Dunaliella salina]